MNPMLHKPKNLKRKSPLRLIVLMGLAGLCFILAANQIGAVAFIMPAP